jgi:hypothetical protein
MTHRRLRPVALPMLDTGRFGRTRVPCRDKIGPAPGQNGNNCADPVIIVIARHSSERESNPDQPQNTAAHARLGASDQPPQPQSP